MANSPSLADLNDSGDEDTLPLCTKLGLPKHIEAYLNHSELLRNVEKVDCDNEVIEKVTSNYILAKQILSNLSWQDKLCCKLVCKTWRSAVQALQREQQSPEDFVLDIQTSVEMTKTELEKSGNIHTEPLVVLSFANTIGFIETTKCNVTTPNPCNPPCDMNHGLLDLVQHDTSIPKDCMYTVRASYMSYMPLCHSPTYKHTITHDMAFGSAPFVGGVYIPKIPDVKFHMININNSDNLQNEFFNVVDELSQTHIFKGVIVYVTEKYILHSVEDIVFLNHFKKVQPDIPFALAGCIVEDAIFGQSETDDVVYSLNRSEDYISEKLISIGVFTIPKTTDVADGGNKSNFDVFSLIVDSTVWTKPAILKAITEFSNEVPRFEHSLVLKLSCVGRDKKHKVEQEYFRTLFPHTRLIGCYGNGELGFNHPERAPASSSSALGAKRLRTSGTGRSLMYSYSTVFLYIGWGKITSPAGPK